VATSVERALNALDGASLDVGLESFAS
jgi:hypothetical protein